jgi:hypothetical protein
MPQSERAIRAVWQYTKIEINVTRKSFVRHVLHLIAGSVGLGAGVTMAADAFQPIVSLVLLALAFIIGGVSFVFASIAADNLLCDYTRLRKLRIEKNASSSSNGDL